MDTGYVIKLAGYPVGRNPAKIWIQNIKSHQTPNILTNIRPDTGYLDRKPAGSILGHMLNLISGPDTGYKKHQISCQSLFYLIWPKNDTNNLKRLNLVYSFSWSLTINLNVASKTTMTKYVNMSEKPDFDVLKTIVSPTLVKNKYEYWRVTQK